MKHGPLCLIPRCMASRRSTARRERWLGNFPQAFSHFALVNCAHTLAGAASGMVAHLGTHINVSRSADCGVPRAFGAALPV